MSNKLPSDNHAETPGSQTAVPHPSRHWRRRLWRSVQLVLMVLCLYSLLVVVGTLPVNRGWRSQAQGIEVFVYSDLVHSELSVPRVTEVVDWSEWFDSGDFEEVTGREEYVGIGWGDREFFMTTPTWDDARATVVAGALFWPSGTVMHVSLRDKPVEGTTTAESY